MIDSKYFPVIPTDIIGRVVDEMEITLNGLPLTMNFQFGRSLDIARMLVDYDGSDVFKSEKYPLVAMVLPTKTRRGLTPSYGVLKIPRIVLATVSNGTDYVQQRFGDTGGYKTILYPMYYDFLNSLAASTEISGNDPDLFPHTIMENPARQQAAPESNDWIDTLEILDLELNLIQIKKCK